MFEFIEKVVYINLENRHDRKVSIEKELSIFPQEKVLRFNAIHYHRGYIGCSMSHIAVLEMAVKEKWSNVLIVEDDAVWTNFSLGYSILQTLVSKPYDVILLGCHTASIDSVYRVRSALSLTGYLVNQSYYQTLLNNFKQGLQLFLKHPHQARYYALDRYWHPLLTRDKWFSIKPNMMYQKASYSDNDRKFTDHTKKFGIYDIKCQRLECNYKIHSNKSNNDGTYCCLSCKNGNKHGPFCEKVLHQLNHT
jgi:glycosyl transferase family 25